MSLSEYEFTDYNHTDESVDSAWDFSVWGYWFKTRPLRLKWMLWVLLLFPLIATTWELKKSVGISPLQIFGVAVFCMATGSILLNTGERTKNNKFVFFLIFAFILIINSLLVFINNISFTDFGNLIRTILPVVLFLYFRRTLNSIEDFEGVLVTFLISSIFPISVLYYEILFDPIKLVYQTESRGGGLRLTGFYADLFNYMSYLIGGLICYFYFFLKSINSNIRKRTTSSLSLIIVLTLFFVGVFNLRHQASWAVSFMLILLLLYYTRKKAGRAQVLLIMIILVILGYFFLNDVFEILFAKDISVIRGDANEQAALNGRVWIWQKYLKYWDEFGLFTKLFGVGFTSHPVTKIMISGGMHSDYIRFFFATGIIGSIFYIIYLVSTLFKAFRTKPIEIRFTVVASILTLLMYSVSSNPLLALGALMYLLIASINFI